MCVCVCMCGWVYVWVGVWVCGCVYIMDNSPCLNLCIIYMYIMYIYLLI